MSVNAPNPFLGFYACQPEKHISQWEAQYLISRAQSNSSTTFPGMTLLSFASWASLTCTIGNVFSTGTFSLPSSASRRISCKPSGSALMYVHQYSDPRIDVIY
uniref:Uncharacterized protein n=1 Tax=Opuntia streptacantha TaxID=393608 RepID=A0A7C9ESV0_OPUST